MDDREDDSSGVTLPKTAFNKLLKSHAPSLRFTPEAREITLQVAHKFITHMATLANRNCEENGRKTIMADHVIAALHSVGLSEYEGEIRECLESADRVTQWRKSKMSSHSFPTEEEEFKRLCELQERMLSEARSQSLIDDAQALAMMEEAASKDRSIMQIQSVDEYPDDYDS